ncbi:MAG: PEGA domain-containing protein [Clostridiales bacterium]|nr:PEGA domain-containing protein [Clostridiales bacterium]
MYKKNKRKAGWRKRALAGCLVLLCGGLLAGCSMSLPWERTASAGKTAGEETNGTGFIPEMPGSYDSADTAVIVERNEEEKTITFFNIPTGRNYTLNYDGTTKITDKYGKGMSMAQVKAGDVTDITFLKSKKKLRSLALSSQVWTNRAEGNYQINMNGKGMLVGKDQYKLADNVMVVSGEEQIGLMDINACDGLILQGIGHTIYSIEIEKGHGYLKLENSEYFTGGWIEVGQSLIQPVTEDMLLTVPEGKYQVLITNQGNGGTKKVTIERNRETVLDVGDLKGEEPVIGNIVFTVDPESASVYIDGDKVDISGPVTLEYGIHQLIVRAEGYETMTKYLKVGQENANISLELEIAEEDREQEEKNVSGNDTADEKQEEENTTSGNTAEPDSTNTVNATDEYRIYITSPKDTEVYFDGKYMGLAPVDFKKESGTHVVTLRRSGYQTRSFTIQIDEEKKDISWSFSELEKTSE